MNDELKAWIVRENLDELSKLPPMSPYARHLKKVNERIESTRATPQPRDDVRERYAFALVKIINLADEDSEIQRIADTAIAQTDDQPDAKPIAWAYDRTDHPLESMNGLALSYNDPTQSMLDGDTGITNIRPLYEHPPRTDCKAVLEEAAMIVFHEVGNHAVCTRIMRKIRKLAEGEAK